MTINVARPRNNAVDSDTDSPGMEPVVITNLHAASVIGRHGTNVGNDTRNSRGGTPWVGGLGSKTLPPNKNIQKPDQRPFDGDVMVNRRSQSVKDLAPQDTLDGQNYANKSPWWDTGNEMKPVNIGNWSASGPQRPSLRLRTFFYRKGSQPNRNMGLHTNISFSPRTLPGRPRMVPGRQNRLTVARYRGQSFSSTTIVLGA